MHIWQRGKDMAQKVSVDQLADAIMEGLEDYADLAADEVKKAVLRPFNKLGMLLETLSGSKSIKPIVIPKKVKRTPTVDTIDGSCSSHLFFCFRVLSSLHFII